VVEASLPWQMGTTAEHCLVLRQATATAPMVVEALDSRHEVVRLAHSSAMVVHMAYSVKLSLVAAKEEDHESIASVEVHHSEPRAA